MAKNYIDNLREEAMKGWSEKLAQGWLPASPPPGYMTVAENGKRIHVPDPATYKNVQKLFKLYLEPKQTIQTITNEKYRLGITTRKGRPFAKSKVHTMLMNPFYVGINRFNGQDTPGLQTQFISKSLFKAVQSKLHDGRPMIYQKHNPILKGMVICAYCNKTVTWQKQKGKLYGSCQRKLDECKAQSLVKEQNVNETIEKMLDDLISPSQQVVSWLTNLLKQDFKTELNNKKDAAVQIQYRIKKLKKMDETLYDDKLVGEITLERYKQKHEAFIKEINDLKDKLGGVDNDYKVKYMEGVTLIELSQVAKQQFTDENTGIDEKRDILTKLFRSIVLKDNFISVNYTKLAQAIAHKSSETRRIYGQA